MPARSSRRELEIVGAIAEALNSAPTVREALDRTLELVTNLLGLQTGWVWLVDAETGHIRDARAQHGTLVLAARSTLRSLRVVPLPADLSDDLNLTPAPMSDAVVIEADGPERQVIRVPGQADTDVSTLDSGDSYRLLVGGVLVTRDGLPETFAELGQWECLDPDTHGACQLPPGPTG